MRKERKKTEKNARGDRDKIIYLKERQSTSTSLKVVVVEVRRGEER